ncbi:DUF4268 domain-containing protein [Treponema zuelzerae]|uniref:DUF4268 domain-containing protein n=1 Tax=Teretinema zuelzerae TaxID=156 RepID=A0AAE3EKF0_9SPIR|nr:DUF4268 domain-containing protein [Teretinema zuelzerae]MCD1655506.1 DUF4268 domain-containing protein [Teretinema zuelzerae]
MFKIDPNTNRIIPLEVKRFLELQFEERKHLQEWLEHAPEVFGEELLFIQKEFDGFDETRERLDLLALDKEGSLVIIENKLDDSGRDVVWQVQKYASYCANLSKSQIIDIYQKYLNDLPKIDGIGPAKAEDKILEFLDQNDINEVVLNRAQSQRLFLVAANYRKEVTNTVLWLIQYGISCQCFKATPYAWGDELFLDIQQIIPPPEGKDFMIGMADKEKEEKATGEELKQRHLLRLAFWESALEAFRKSKCRLFDSISPSKDHWLSAGSGTSGLIYELIFGKDESRIQVNIVRQDATQNLFAFNKLLEKKEVIEHDFGQSLDWLELPGKKSSRIQYAKAFDGYTRQNWVEIVQWMVSNMTKLEQAMQSHLDSISKELRTLPQASSSTPSDI